MSFLLAAVSQLIGANLRGARAAESRLHAMQIARRLLTDLPSDAQLRQGSRQGQGNGARWTVEVRPFAKELFAGWQPQEISVTVSVNNSSPLTVRTVRLARAQVE